jgi:hypothetical protein
MRLELPVYRKGDIVNEKCHVWQEKRQFHDEAEDARLEFYIRLMKVDAAIMETLEEWVPSERTALAESRKIGLKTTDFRQDFASWTGNNYRQKTKIQSKEKYGEEGVQNEICRSYSNG